MAYFAQLNSLNKVIQVISINNIVLGEPNIAFPSTEPIGQEFIYKNLMFLGEWKQTSYNNSFRKNYAGIGFYYDPQRDAFIPPKPFSSWILNEETCQWNPPVPRPDGNWRWDESEIVWKEVTNDPI